MIKSKALDLFAGAGGMSLGLTNAGFEVSHAIEIDKWASDTYRKNHPKTKVLTKDIVSICEAFIASFNL